MFTEERALMMFTKHRVCGVQPGLGGGCYSAAETPEAEALLQVQNYLKLCTQAPYQRFFKAIVIDECQLI